MRIVVDLQSPQGESKNRGMGRYSLALALAMAKVVRDHEIWIALNGLFPDTLDPLRKVFEGLLPPPQIAVWQAPEPVGACDPANTWRRETAELLRESFLAGLKPDIVHVSSLFEGFGDNCVSSVGKGPEVVPTAVTLYDLIPLIFNQIYLKDPQVRDWYYQKLQWLKNADLWLAISEHTRREAIERLGLPEDRVVNISAGYNPMFRPVEVDLAMEESLRARYGLSRAFVLYTGGIDPRKNVEGSIEAYARLPLSLRKTHQLVIVCHIQEHDRRRLFQLARRGGLTSDDLVFTGFVPDEDLVALYNLCTLFVFPSLYEGFGLPPLEAMACGAPVIASNASSLPEVVGWEKALFDPKTPEAIAGKIQEALTDEVFREALSKHGLEQARRFSWEESAQRTLAAFDNFHAEHAKTKPHLVTLRSSKPRLAYLSPLPPTRSGIADYSRELLPELARHYQIELIVDQPEVTDPWLSANFPIRNVAWFERHDDHYDRVLYHFGNSEFHKHMFELLQRHPGGVVLHDFYLSGALRWMDNTGYAPGIFRRELYRAHGYGALAELAERGDEAAALKYPCNLSVVEGADGVIVHSRHAVELIAQWYGQGAAEDWWVIPQIIKPAIALDRAAARAQLGLGEKDFLVCSFGFVAPIKLLEILLEGWLRSKLARSPGCKLVFVGTCLDEAFARNLREQARQAGVSDRVQFTGYVSRDVYERYLAASDVAVQLRTNSRGETARSVLEALAWGLPTVINAHGWMDELPDNVALKLPEQVRPQDVARALEEFYEKPDRCRRLGEVGRAHAEEVHAPPLAAKACFQAIERFARTGRHARRRRLVRDIAQIESACSATDEDLATTAMAIAANAIQTPNVRQILVDVSTIAKKDYGTGIQRVTRAHLKNLIETPPEGWRGEPVYATPPSAYRYARAFTADCLRMPLFDLPDDVVEANTGDIFLGLDLTAHLIPNCIPFFEQLKAKRVQIYFVVYDLLTIHNPKWWPPEMYSLLARWLEVIADHSDGIVCISRSVADQLLNWLETTRPCRKWPLKIGYFHLGADVESAQVPKGNPEDLNVFEMLARSDSAFLMVGTVEPRKGHAQTLAAFEELWRSGINVSLIIVGKQGWMVEPLVEQLRTHSEQGKRLCWLEGVSDVTLRELYRRSTALIMASWDEGFGLPLIEAAWDGLPIIARDIPVFREVCGDHAFYFNGMDAESLTSAIKDWLGLHRQGRAPSVEGTPVLTWEQSTQQLLDVILNGNWYKTWEPDDS